MVLTIDLHPGKILTGIASLVVRFSQEGIANHQLGTKCMGLARQLQLYLEVGQIAVGAL